MDYVPDYSLKPITFKRPHRPTAQPQHPTTTKRLQRRSDAHALSSLREAQHPQEAQARQLCPRSPRDPNASAPEKAVTRQQGLPHPQGAPRPTTAHGRTLPPSTAQPTPPSPGPLTHPSTNPTAFQAPVREPGQLRTLFTPTIRREREPRLSTRLQ